MSKTENKKISINALEKIMEENYVKEKTIEWNGLEIVINHTLTLSQMLDFVNSVTQSCFSSVDGSYLPEVKDFATKCCIAQLYANIRLPKDIELRYNLIYRTNVVEAILTHINLNQLEEITNAIDDKVDNAAQSKIEAATKQMNELYNTFNNLQENMSAMFADINPSDLSNFMNTVAGTNLDEKSLIDAYINNAEKNTDKQNNEDEVEKTQAD